MPVCGRDQREELAAGIVNDHHRGMAEIGLLELRSFLPDDGFEVVLEGEVDAGADGGVRRGGSEGCEPGSGLRIAERAKAEL